MSIRMEMTCARTATVEVHPWARDLSRESREAWLGLLAPSDDPVLYPGWTEALVTSGAIRPWRVLTFRDAGRLVGLLPLIRRSPVGAEAPSMLAPDQPPLLVASGAEVAVGRAVAEAVREGDAPLICLGRVHDVDRMMGLCAGIREGGAYAWLRDVCPTVIATLPRTWDHFLEGLSRSGRSSIRRAERRWAEAMPGAGHQVCDDPAALDAMLSLRERQWGRAGAPAACDPHMRLASRTAMADAMTRGLAAVHLVGVPTSPAAAAVVLHTPGAPTALYYITARDLSLDSALRPGRALLAAIVRWAISQGIRTLRLGQGEFPYKREMGGVARQQWEVWVAPTRWQAHALAKCDAAFAQIRRWGRGVLWTR